MDELGKRFAHWLSTLEPHLRRATSGPWSWLGLALNIAGLFTLISLLPAVSAFFDLQLIPATLAFVPAWILGFAGGLLERQGRLSLRAWGVIALVNSALMHFFAFSLIVLSAGAGSMLFAGIALLTSGFHGFVFRASLSTPFSFVAALLGGAAAFVWAPDQVQALTVIVVLPVALGLHLLLGHAGKAGHFEQRERQALRDAIQAQLLVEQAEGLRRVKRTVFDLRSNAHDAGNVLSSVLFNVQALSESAQRVEGNDATARRIRDIAEDLQLGLDRLQALVRGNTSAQAGVEVQTLHLREQIEHICDVVGALYPDTTVALHIDPAHAHLRLPIAGGASLLQRVVENLLHNACEGDGVRRARRVEVELDYRPDAEAQLVLEVRDDGPGFPDYMLGAPVAAYETTKAGGTGLGLYTVDRLVHACGGHMRRSNRDQGGACVRIDLPRGDR